MMASKYEVKEGDLVRVPQNTVFYGIAPSVIPDSTHEISWTYMDRLEEPVTAVVAGFDEVQCRAKLYCKIDDAHDLVWCDLKDLQVIGEDDVSRVEGSQATNCA